MQKTPSHHVSAEIRAHLARRRLRQDELAAALNLSQTAVSNRLNGLVPWDINELVAAATFLDVPLAALLTKPDKASA